MSSSHFAQDGKTKEIQAELSLIDIKTYDTTVLELADKSQFLQPVATRDVQSSAISKVRKNIDNKNISESCTTKQYIFSP